MSEMRKGYDPAHRALPAKQDDPAPSWMRIDEISRRWQEETGESRISLERELSEWYAAFGLRADAARYKGSGSDSLAALMELMGSPHIDRDVFALFCDETGRPRPNFWFSDEAGEFDPTQPDMHAADHMGLSTDWNRSEPPPPQQPRQIEPQWKEPPLRSEPQSEEVDPSTASYSSPGHSVTPARPEFQRPPSPSKEEARVQPQDSFRGSQDSSPEARFRRAALSRMESTDSYQSRVPAMAPDNEAFENRTLPGNSPSSRSLRLEPLAQQPDSQPAMGTDLPRRQPGRHSVLQSEASLAENGVDRRSHLLAASRDDSVLDSEKQQRPRRRTFMYAATLAVVLLVVGGAMAVGSKNPGEGWAQWFENLTAGHDPAEVASAEPSPNASESWSLSSVTDAIGAKLAETFELEPMEAGLSDPKSVSSNSRQQVAEGANLVLLIQEYLKESGFYAGPLTGKLDNLTRQEIGKYKKQHGLGADDWVTLELLDHLEVSALTKRAASLDGQGNYVMAIAAYDQLIRLQPQNSSILMQRAQAYKKAGLDKKALADLDQAVAIDPNYVDAYLGRAKFNYETGQYGDALKDYFLGAKAWVTQL